MPPVRRSKRVASTNAKGSPMAETSPSTRLNNSAAAPASPHLLTLPREILLRTTTYLPAESATCLTLTCKTALSRLGKASWAEFSGATRRHYGYFNPLFNLLQRDLPGHVHCSTCDILHPPLKPPRAHRRTKYTRNCLYEDPVIDFWPRTENGEGPGYSLVRSHLVQARQSSGAPQDVNPIPLFSGDYTVHPGNVKYRLVSAARWVGLRRNILITQEHRLKSAMAGQPLRAEDVLAMPLRVCAHLSTTTEPPPQAEQGRSAYRKNGPLLSHAVIAAFPDNMRGDIDLSPRPDGPFRKLTGTEMNQYRDAASDNSYIWRCTSCPTRFRIEYKAEDLELLVTAWHSFGADPKEEDRFWTMFALRTGPDLPPKKRNCEFFVTERPIPDFEMQYVDGPVPCKYCKEIHAG
ncbi:hypothetical protein BJX65DRAFT_315354 [Aspergillus insuetus]